MRAADEKAAPSSCLNRAHPDELTFVLLERDLAAPSVIRFWAEERVRLGKNMPGDGQINEAYELARQMESRQRAGSVPHR